MWYHSTEGYGYGTVTSLYTPVLMLLVTIRWKSLLCPLGLLACSAVERVLEEADIPNVVNITQKVDITTKVIGITKVAYSVKTVSSVPTPTEERILGGEEQPQSHSSSSSSSSSSPSLSYSSSDQCSISSLCSSSSNTELNRVSQASQPQCLLRACISRLVNRKIWKLFIFRMLGHPGNWSM